MLKLLTAVNDEYQRLFREDELLTDSQCFEEQDERIFSFKHKIIKWMKEVELKIEEKIKVADLIAESNFTEQKLKMEYEAKRLELEEKVAKAQASQDTGSFGYVPMRR